MRTFFIAGIKWDSNSINAGTIAKYSDYRKRLVWIPRIRLSSEDFLGFGAMFELMRPHADEAAR